MKNLLIVSGLALITTTSVFATPGDHRKNEKDHSRVERTAADNAFYREFGNIPVLRWERIGYMDVAVFRDNSLEKHAFFDDMGTLVGTTAQIDYRTIPEAARNFITKHYPGYQVAACILYDDNEANDSEIMIYETLFGGRDNYFIELTNGDKKIVLESDLQGNVKFFNTLHP